MKLSEKLNSMKFEYKMASPLGTPEPSVFLIPRRKDIVKMFVEDLVNELGEETTGSKPYVFHCLWTGENEMTFCDLRIELHDGDDVRMA